MGASGFAGSLSVLLRERLVDSADHTVCSFVQGDGSQQDVSGSELAGRAMAFAAAFGANDSARASVVAISAYHGLDLHAAFVGALWAGHTPTMIAPPSPRMEPQRYAQGFRGMLGAIRPAMIVVDEATLERLASAQLDAATDAAVGRMITAERVQAAGEVAVQSRSLDAMAVLQHSSGTTGLQKGVALTSRQVLAHNRAYLRHLEISSDDVIVSWLPLYHDMGFVACFLMPLLSGIRIVEISPFDWVRSPALLLDAIHRERGTLCWLPNFAFSFLAQQFKPERAAPDLDLSSVRAWINSSEPVVHASFQEFLECFRPYGVTEDRLTASYAMAENVYAVTQSAPGRAKTLSVDADAFKDHRVVAREGEGCRIFASNGSVVDGTELCIRTPDGSDRTDGGVGEILIRGDYLFSGYLERDDLTAAVMTPDGWYRTGDLGFVHEGEVYVTGRSKDLIIIQGRNFYPADFEEVAVGVAGVKPGRAVAFGVADERTGTEGLVILVEGEEGVDGRRLALAIRKRIAQEFDCTPRDVKAVPDRWLIKSTSGKLARSANREKYLSTRPAASQ